MGTNPYIWLFYVIMHLLRKIIIFPTRSRTERKTDNIGNFSWKIMLFSEMDIPLDGNLNWYSGFSIWKGKWKGGAMENGCV
jgi:hypothetical protein